MSLFCIVCPPEIVLLFVSDLTLTRQTGNLLIIPVRQAIRPVVGMNDGDDVARI